MFNWSICTKIDWINTKKATKFSKPQDIKETWFFAFSISFLIWIILLRSSIFSKNLYFGYKM
jgi:hypothetical protein